MKIIRNGKEINGKDGKIILLSDGQKIAVCVCENTFDEQVTYAVFVDEIDGKYYLSDESVDRTEELNYIVSQYLSETLAADIFSADNITIGKYDESVVDEEIAMEKNNIDTLEIEDEDIDTPRVFATLDIGEDKQLDLKVYKYENVGNISLAFEGETRKNFVLFQKVRLCKVLNPEVVHFSSLKYFLEMISNLQIPLEVEVNGYSEKPPYNSKKFKVAIDYVLINSRMQYVSSYGKNRAYSNCLADHIITYNKEEGYGRRFNDEKSEFKNFNERVEYMPDMDIETCFYKNEQKRRF